MKTLISNLFSESEKQWVIEKSAVPIKTGGAYFEVETEVKWCPETNEILYRKPQNTGFFEEDWAQVTEHSDLYKKLLGNFKRKHSHGQTNTKRRTSWTKIHE